MHKTRSPSHWFSEVGPPTAGRQGSFEDSEVGTSATCFNVLPCLFVSFLRGEGCGWRDSWEIKPTLVLSESINLFVQFVSFLFSNIIWPDVLLGRWAAGTNGSRGTVSITRRRSWGVALKISHSLRFPMNSKQLPFRMVGSGIPILKTLVNWSSEWFLVINQMSSFPEHMVKAVVKQLERLEAKTFGLGSLGQGFILGLSWEAYQSWSKLWWNQHGHQQTPLQSFR